MALDTPTEVKKKKKSALGELMKSQGLTKEVQSSKQLKFTAIFAYSSRE